MASDGKDVVREGVGGVLVDRDGGDSPTAGNESAKFLRSWVSEHKDWLERRLLKHGIIATCCLHSYLAV